MHEYAVSCLKLQHLLYPGTQSFSHLQDDVHMAQLTGGAISQGPEASNHAHNALALVCTAHLPHQPPRCCIACMPHIDTFVVALQKHTQVLMCYQTTLI